MNLNNILTGICKAFVKKQRFMCGDHDDCVGVSYDGFHAYFIPKTDFPFDQTKLGLPVDWKALLPKNSTDATLTNELMSKDKVTLQKVTDGKTEVWINTAFLKNFDKSATFKMTGVKSPILVFEDDTMVGLILPVRVTNN